MLTLSALLSLAACAGPPPTAPFAVPPMTLAAQPAPQGLREEPLFATRLVIDTASESVDLERSASATDRFYNADLSAFFEPEQLQLREVRWTAQTLELDLAIAHPFHAPNFAQAASASNRADLGFAGRLLVMAEIPESRRAASAFFAGTVRANAGLVAEPDGFLQPRGLTESLAYSNTFPYLLVVDEALDNRLGDSNEGQPAGSYDPDLGGWQRANIGSDRTGWTGYGFLHAGQVATRTLVLNREALLPGPMPLDLVLLGRYIDPKAGASPWLNRLPPTTPSIDRFAYRLPFGAIDCERVQQSAPIEFTAGDTGAQAQVHVAVRDWDAQATATTLASLALDPAVGHVRAGSPGLPGATLDAPLINPSGPIGLTCTNPTATGHPGAEFQFTAALTHATNRPIGSYWGLVRVLDPELVDPARLGEPYQVDVDDTLRPVPSGHGLQPVTYQALRIDIAQKNLPPTCAECGPSTHTYRPLRPVTLDLSGFRDDSALVGVRVAYDGPWSDTTSTDSFTPNQLAQLPALNPWAGGDFATPLAPPSVDGTYDFFFEVIDGEHTVRFGPWELRAFATGNCPQVGFGGSLIDAAPLPDGARDLRGLIPGEFEWPGADPMLVMASYRTLPGWVLTQGRSGNFYRVNVHDHGVEQVSTLYPGFGPDRRALLLDIDHRGRGFWVSANINQSESPDPTLAEIYQNAGTSIHVFDALSPTPVTVDLATIEVGRPIVALCVDEEDGIWIVDNQNRLRRFIDTGEGGSGPPEYEEDPGGGYPLGPVSQGGISGAAVFDVDRDFYNDAFYLVVQTTEQELAIWRIECDGTLIQPGGNENPLRELQGQPILDAAIAIDNYAADGTILNGQQDAQILVAAENGTGWLGIITSEMARSASTVATNGTSRLALLYHSNLALTLPYQMTPLSRYQWDRWRLAGGWE